LNLVGHNKKVLEIGCSTGTMSKRLAQNGCEVIGIEIDEDSAKIAKNYCRDVLTCDVETIEHLPYCDFDFILLLDVLEHLRSPLESLTNLKVYLKKGGSIIVSIPNVANWRVRWDLLFGRFEYTEYGILDKTHLRFFNENGARELLRDAGFNIAEFDIVPRVPINVRSSIAYAIANIRPKLFAGQFIMVGKLVSP
jgi:O-antigen biosynthesis protein